MMSPSSVKSKRPVKINPEAVASKEPESEGKVVYDTKELNLWYTDTHALKDVNLSFREKEVTAIIGPSGCGKSTYIKTLNRMVELVPGVRTTGEITYKGKKSLNVRLK